MDLALTPAADDPSIVWQMPPCLVDDRGSRRRVGVEIEFGGLHVPALADLVREMFGGHVVNDNTFSAEVRDTALGDFRVELDSMILKRKRYDEWLSVIGVSDETKVRVEAVLEKVASSWIPHEIITPPIFIDDLHRLERLRIALHGMGAQGTRASLVNMFGFQLNPQVPSRDAASILAHLRAFLALYDHLAIAIDVDLARRALSFTEPFPESYRRKVLDPRYAPDFATLLGDYLDENPTRNRALDMLPFFAYVDEATVKARCKEPDQVKPRPTFHYRLPNCCIDDPTWTFALEWNRWVEVERLAADPERLARVSADAITSIEEGWSVDKVLQAAATWGLSSPTGATPAGAQP